MTLVYTRNQWSQQHNCYLRKGSIWVSWIRSRLSQKIPVDRCHLWSHSKRSPHPRNPHRILVAEETTVKMNPVYGLADKAGKTDPVYGLAICLRYLSSRQCSECFIEVATELKASSTQSCGGRIHCDGCFLRYENSSFYGDSNKWPIIVPQQMTAIHRHFLLEPRLYPPNSWGSIGGTILISVLYFLFCQLGQKKHAWQRMIRWSLSGIWSVDLMGLPNIVHLIANQL